MNRRPWQVAATVLGVLLASVLVAACGSEDEATPAPSASASASTAAPGGSVDSLRDIDFTSAPYAADLITRAGGGDVRAERVTFEDLTGDGIEEAVVVVESGGTLGDIGVAVYRLEGGVPEVALFRQFTGGLELRLGLVVVKEGVYAADDPLCCPSQLQETVIGWQDGAFEVLSEQVIDNPAP